MISLVRDSLLAGQQALESLLDNSSSLQNLADGGIALAECLKDGGRAFSCGNGGSMSDAMHFAEELSGRFRSDRPAMSAIAISDPGHLSCVANDFGFEFVFSRYLEANGRRGDFLLAISTSGNSKNVINAAKEARHRGMTVLSLTGRQGSPLGGLAHFDVCTPGGSIWADRVQELHVKCLHILIEISEKLLLSGS